MPLHRLAATLVALVAVVGCSDNGPPTARSIWKNSAGNTIVAYAGEKHCGWQTATILPLYDKHQYVRDPDSVIDSQSLLNRYIPRTTLPSDATNTGYTNGNQQLWLSADESAVFVVDGATVEQWPRTVPGWGCD